MSDETTSPARWLLVASNVFFLPAILVAWRNIQVMWLEFYIYFLVTAASVLNHVCWSYQQTDKGESSIYGVPCSTWNHVDVFLSYSAIVATMVWIAFVLGNTWRYPVTVLILAIPVVSIFYDEPIARDNLPYYMLGIGIPYFVLMVVTGFWRNLYPRGIVAAVLFSGLAAGAFALGADKTDQYVLFHTPWHVAIGIALYVVVSARKGQRPMGGQKPLIAALLGNKEGNTLDAEGVASKDKYTRFKRRALRAW